MKNKNFFISSFMFFVITSFAFAEEFECPVNTEILSQIFKNNWTYLPAQKYYFSSAELKINNQDFSGALHTYRSELPNDHDPHLKFADVFLRKVPERLVWQIDCRYFIGNNAMTDLEDGYLHLSTTWPMDKRCMKLAENKIKRS